jgi:hypothetical protein
MSISSESAEQMTGMILKTEEVCLRVTGTAAKEIVALLAAILKDQKQTKGKTRLTNMLKSGKELKVFSVKQQDLKKFMQEAKRYGVLYSALIDKHNKNFDGMVDIMVRAEDASKINRIVERFKIATVNEAELRSEIEKTKAEKAKTPEAKEIGVEQKDIEVKEQEKQENAPIQKEEKQVPLPEKDSKKNLSKNSSKMLKKQEGNTKVNKKSVREDLKEIKEEMAKEEKSSSKSKNLSKGTKNKTKSNKKKDKLR